MEINKIRFYYVGAALCVGILDNEDKVLGYFDVGCLIGNDVKGLAENLKCIAAKNELDITKKLEDGVKFIIISHWHNDHCNIAYKLRGKTDAKCFTETIWYVPQAVTIMGHKAKYWNDFNEGIETRTLKDRFKVIKNGDIETTPEGIKIYKISSCIDTESGRHIHHNGLFATVKLEDNGKGTDVLLAGDCTYSLIQQRLNSNIKFDYLQVCHHGGNFAYSPYDTKEEEKLISYIPRPKDEKSEVIYSANGITHKHPSKTLLHEEAGWEESVMLHKIGGICCMPYYDVPKSDPCLKSCETYNKNKQEKDIIPCCDYKEITCEERLKVCLSFLL